VVAITSLEHSRAVASRHPSGLRLFAVATLCLDTLAPYGDTAVPSQGRARRVQRLLHRRSRAGPGLDGRDNQRPLEGRPGPARARKPQPLAYDGGARAMSEAVMYTSQMAKSSTGSWGPR
jgi:hypothetical protein